MRWLIPIVLLILWFFFANNWLSNKKASCCNKESSTVTKAVVANSNSSVKRILDEQGPLLFAWSDCLPKTRSSWSIFRDSLVNALPKDHLLDIKTWSYKAEKNNCDSKKLADSRAEQMRALFGPYLDKDKFRISSLLRDDKNEDWKSHLFRAASYKYALNKTFVKEIDNKALIYFPTGSARKLGNKEIDDYLKDVAVRVKKSGEKIRLTGHTDNTGGTSSNQKLGQKRADQIKQILIKMGVKAKQISTSSRGENAPIADNKTSAGRQKNRRTELQISK